MLLDLLWFSTSHLPLPWSPYNADVTTPDNSLQGIIKASSSMLLQHSENYKPLLQMLSPPLTPEMVHMMSHTMW